MEKNSRLRITNEPPLVALSDSRGPITAVLCVNMRRPAISNLQSVIGGPALCGGGLQQQQSEAEGLLASQGLDVPLSADHVHLLTDSPAQ